MKVGQEIRKLQWCEYIKNGLHGRRHILGFVTSHSPNKIYKNLLSMDLKEYFATVF